MFYRLDFMSHSRDKFYASTRLVSRHTLGGDVCGSGDAMHIVNGENVLAGLMAYGTTLFLQSGNEYHNIYPLWDWGRLPSVTSPDIALRLDAGSLCGKSFAGGASVDSFGACGISFERDYEFEGEPASFGGRKAVFYFEDELYLMGGQLRTTSAAAVPDNIRPMLFSRYGNLISRRTYAASLSWRCRTSNGQQALPQWYLLRNA